MNSVITKTKIGTKEDMKINPNKLPFLQAQILGKIYYDLYENSITKIEDLAELTDYPKESKILNDAVLNLVTKKFISGNFQDGFNIPKNNTDLQKKIVKFNDYKHKIFSRRIFNIGNSNNNENNLFPRFSSISELNKIGCVHKWYNYLEEFPFGLIEEKLIEYNINPNSLVCDPFAGSGTTLVSSNLFQFNAIGFDTNPLMTFISKVKTNFNVDLEDLKNIVIETSEKFINQIHSYDSLNIGKSFINYMPKKELNQWLSPSLQKESNLLKSIIDEVKNTSIKNILKLALAKSTFDASYVSLCPGTTFYPYREKSEFWDLFTEKIFQIFQDLQNVQRFDHYGKSTLIDDSCLNASKYIEKDSLDFIITSPPYPNDLEYTRQTRLELYLLDFVKSMEDVQQIKRNMVKGSTKLIFKESNSEKFIKNFKSIKIVSDKISEQTKDKNWGFDYSRMVREYFGDMFLVMKEFYPLMKQNSYFLQVVGDQTIKGVYIPVCDILIEMATYLGYKECRKELFRMRRSTGHNIDLPEEIVIIKR